MSLGAANAMPAPTTVYWCRAEVVFLPPTDRTGWTNSLQGANESLVSFAAAVERRVNGGQAAPRLASTDATLYGAGVTQGRSISLRNTGGQWQPSYGQPSVTVEVVGVTPEETMTQTRQALGEVTAASRAMQRELGVSDSSAITAQVSPQVLSLSRVSGSQRRSKAVILLLGAGASLLVFMELRRRQATHRHRVRHASPVPR